MSSQSLTSAAGNTKDSSLTALLHPLQEVIVEDLSSFELLQRENEKLKNMLQEVGIKRKSFGKNHRRKKHKLSNDQAEINNVHQIRDMSKK